MPPVGDRKIIHSKRNMLGKCWTELMLDWRYLQKIVCWSSRANGGVCKVSKKHTKTAEFSPFKDKTCLFYIRTQCVARSEHSPLRLYKTYLLILYQVKVHTEHLNAT
jgi:hypothetical protein